MEEDKLAFRVGVFGFDLVDGLSSFLLRAHGDKYFSVVLVEDRGKLFSNSRRGPSDDEDLTHNENLRRLAARRRHTFPD